MTDVSIPTPSDLSVALPSFRRSLRAARKSPRTIDAYLATSQAFLDWLIEQAMPTDVKLIKRAHVEDWLIALEERGNTPSTVATRYRCLQQLFRWLEDEGEIDLSPMLKMHPPQIPEQLVPLLSVDEQRRLLATCKGTSFEERRDLAIISLFLDGGFRLAELTNLVLTDVDLDNGAAVVAGKGSRVRVVRFGATAARNLDRYLRARHAHADAERCDALWLGGKGVLASAGVGRMVRRRATQAGIKHLHPHMFRHTFAHAFRSNGGSEGDLMMLGGWRSRAMIDRYGRAAAADRAAEAHTRFSPLDNL